MPGILATDVGLFGENSQQNKLTIPYLRIFCNVERMGKGCKISYIGKAGISVNAWCSESERHWRLPSIRSASTGTLAVII